MTKDEEQEKLSIAQKQNSFTSPTIDDVDFDGDDTYFWDCCNADYCEKTKNQNYGRRCMKGTKEPRCSREEKITIRDIAKSKKFRFPNDAK